MKKVLVLVVLVVAGFIAYRQMGDSQQVKVYKQFADAWSHGQIDQALTFAEGEAIRQTLQEKSVQRLMGGVAIQTHHGVRYRIASEGASGSGEGVRIEAKQTILFDPPGVESAIRASMYASFVEVAELTRTASGWKVISFEPTFEKMDEMPKPQ